MDDFKTALIIDRIKSQKHAKGLIKEINRIKDWYINAPFLRSDNGNYHTLICNVYKCLTLAMSRYIAKYSSPLPKDAYKVKHSMELNILSNKFLNLNKPTYEWLIDTFQYAKDIPASISNGKQVIVENNRDYIILNKLALLVKDRDVPFTIDFNSKLGGYYGNLLPSMMNSIEQTMEELIVIQTLKSRANNKSKANSNITYTLFERVIDEKLEELLKFEYHLSFKDSTKILRESIQSMEILDSRYLEMKAKRKHNE